MYTLKRLYKYRIMYFFLAPAVLFSLIFSYKPMVGIVMAFQDYDIIKGINGSRYVGFENFKLFIQDPDFWNALKNTLGINFFSILFGFPLPIALAILIFEMKDGVIKRITQTISYLPHFVSWVVVSGLVYKILDVDGGLINLVIKGLGMEAIPFMREPSYFWAIVIIAAIWKELGWNTIIYLAALSSINSEQYESAEIDGATGIQKLFCITLPGISPVIGLMLIFTMGTLIGSNGNVSYDAIFNMRNALVARASDTIDYYIYLEGVLNVRYGFSTAVGLFQSIVSFFLVIFSNYLSRKIRGYGAF